MSAPVSITRNGHRTFFKWHRARRFAADPVFTGRRILEGMAMGASVEVDLLVTRDGNLAVLHDDLLDRETTGQGPVADADAAAIRQLHLRDNDGAPIPDRVMLLDDLCALMRAGEVHPDALLQLDFKQDETVLDARVIENFARALDGVAGTMLVSAHSAIAVDMLTAAVPGLRSGFDPSDEARFRAALERGNLQRFVDDALAAALTAEMIYLYWPMVLHAEAAGFDLIAAFHRAGKRIDAWTIETADETTLPIVEKLLALRADQITTDDPEGLASLLQSRL
jgi:glycerophosphoryl diester phosphodiesterase